MTKLHKLGDRLAQPNRLNDKDAHDVYRILVAVPTAGLAARVDGLSADPVSSAATAIGVERLRTLFASPDGIGSQMAARAAGPLADPETIAAATAALADDLLRAVRT